MLHQRGSDGAFAVVHGQGGGGVVIRDHHGGFVAGSCHFSHLFLILNEQSSWPAKSNGAGDSMQE
jgi:hypothetical protein